MANTCKHTQAEARRERKIREAQDLRRQHLHDEVQRQRGEMEERLRREHAKARQHLADALGSMSVDELLGAANRCDSSWFDFLVVSLCARCYDDLYA